MQTILRPVDTLPSIKLMYWCYADLIVYSKLFWVDAWDQTLRSVTVDDLEVTLEFDFRASLGARALFGLVITSHDTGYVTTWHEGDVIEVNLT